MFESLKRKYINWQVKKRVESKSWQREKRFVNWSNAHNITVLLSYQNVDLKEITRVKETLADKNTTLWIFVDTKQEIAPSDKVVFLTKQSVSAFGKPNDTIIKNFLKEESDIVIDLTEKEIFPIKYLLGISTAHCRCGLKKADYHYDFEISENGQVRRIDLLDQILYYLKTIKEK